MLAAEVEAEAHPRDVESAVTSALSPGAMVGSPVAGSVCLPGIVALPGPLLLPASLLLPRPRLLLRSLLWLTLLITLLGLLWQRALCALRLLLRL